MIAQNINSAHEAIISGLFQLSNERRFKIICNCSSNGKNVTVCDDFMTIVIKQKNLLSKYFLLSAKANVHLMHLTMVAKTIVICVSINALFMSTIKEINFAEMLRLNPHDSGKNLSFQAISSWPYIK